MIENKHYLINIMKDEGGILSFGAVVSYGKIGETYLRLKKQHQNAGIIILSAFEITKNNSEEIKEMLQKEANGETRCP